MILVVSDSAYSSTFLGDNAFAQELREIEIDLIDPEPPIRAYGIRRILTFIRAPNQVILRTCISDSSLFRLEFV